MKKVVLVADDEKNIRDGLSENFELEGYEVRTAADGRDALLQIEKGGIDAVVTDLRMPRMTGEQLLSAVTQKMPGLPVIVLTAHGSVDGAVAAMSRGAYNFLTKPVDLNQLNLTVRRALENKALADDHRQLQDEVARLKKKGAEADPLSSMIGRSAELQKVFSAIRKVAPASASVLVTGENGVGKELVARAIHSLSPRAKKPFVAVNCSALSESLLESELFGHEKGAYTGADSMSKGRFELADGGTIFLDEIGEVNASVQVKLLRVLQERQFERVGGQGTIGVDVRVIAATNKNLEAEMAAGRFREDLYYRLNVVSLFVPPLRERKDDVPLLIAHYLGKFSAENGKEGLYLSNAAKSLLYQYDWPGNIRQLRNCVESAVVMCSGSRIEAEDLPPSLRNSAASETICVPAGSSLAEAERIVICQTLAACKGNKSRAAEVLGIGRKTLHRKLSEYGLASGEEGA